jgi:VanZ family protein
VVNNRGRVRRVFAILALAWALLLLYVGSRPGGSLPESGVPHADKAFHALAYGVLGALVARAFGARGRRALLLGALAGLSWGILDEWVQGRVPGRTQSWADLLADVLGAAGGALLARSRPRAPSATMPDPLPRGEGK